ncbi:hypothetical protein [Chitinophaga sancti]|uniref:Uncharacterized protein n=1 Tax=Chitinophaga sancti TaxID=1004 RepID=A0A1K1SMC0_9BACT|nr:hypothetical protein [Chitinophaga sancti]WQD63925.1 hypothetical protein U0033_05915 [Chitinophaga sancti]WQG90450.1 hypothetical protein SR876_03005 [Chitinophaga sancti]SFW85438.1 hypothetical protein SAMN05661012_05741 [Chitinophaga sancti]
MTNDYKDIKFLSLLFIAIVVTGGLILTSGFYYCLFFASSLGIMTAYAINERKRIFRIMIDLREIKFSRNLVYIINIIVGYQHHYKEHPLSFKGGFWVVALLQVISLFLLVYCIEDKPKS